MAGLKPRARSQQRSVPRPSPYLIEGEYVTIEEIAARLELSDRGARNRLARERQREGAVTWEALAAP